MRLAPAYHLCKQCNLSAQWSCSTVLYRAVNCSVPLCTPPPPVSHLCGRLDLCKQCESKAQPSCVAAPPTLACLDAPHHPSFPGLWLQQPRQAVTRWVLMPPLARTQRPAASACVLQAVLFSEPRSVPASIDAGAASCRMMVTPLLLLQPGQMRPNRVEGGLLLLFDRGLTRLLDCCLTDFDRCSRTRLPWV